MSVDFYVAVPAAEWPSQASAQQCMQKAGFRVTIERFPVLKSDGTNSDGAQIVIDGKRAYLEGELSPADAAPEDVRLINQRLTASGDGFRISSNHALMSVRARSALEVRAASYVISALINCFDGYGFEPQGNGHGRSEFAKGLTEQQFMSQE